MATLVIEAVDYKLERIKVAVKSNARTLKTAQDCLDYAIRTLPRALALGFGSGGVQMEENVVAVAAARLEASKAALAAHKASK